MLFELRNAFASFQDYINKILTKKFGIFVIIYLNNIFIYTKDPDQGYIKAIKWMLDILQSHRFFTNLKKC